MEDSQLSGLTEANMISHRLSFAVALMIAAPALAQDDAPWRDAERAVLTNHVQLTTGEQFVKAGESYFSPDGSMIIFQAVEVPEGDEAASPFYGMYVADLVRTDGRITGIDDVRRVSPLGSSNTCGWFHPTKPNTVIFGTTFAEPAEPDIAGYQRGTGRYKWQFPREMTVVECDLTKADGTAATLTPIRSDPKAYLAECSFTTDGRSVYVSNRF